MADLLQRQGLLADPRSPMASKAPHFAAKAKAVISILCYGGVSRWHVRSETAAHAAPGRTMRASAMTAFALAAKCGALLAIGDRSARATLPLKQVGHGDAGDTASQFPNSCRREQYR